MRTPKVTLPEEDPATKAAREREQLRAESARTEETQAWLMGATGRRNRRFGALAGGSSGGSVPVVGGPSAGGGGGASGGLAFGSGAPTSGAGGGANRFGQFSRSLSVMY